MGEGPDHWLGKHCGQLFTTLPSGQRLVACVSAGLFHESRSPAGHKNFWQVVGRAVTSSFADGTDLLAVCVPRSERYRKLAAQYRQSEGILRSRVVILTVDRMGQVDGLPTFA